MDFLTTGYLQNGSEKQRHVFKVLQESGLFLSLAPFTPVLTGTIPLGIDIPGSDLDIICEFQSIESFYTAVRTHFSNFDSFTLRTSVFQDKETVVSSFEFGGFMFEIFGQPIPVTEQYAYRHMVVESRLLEQGGEEVRQKIIYLKLQGWKTEPAFAECFGITGNAYEELYRMYQQ